MAKTYRGRKVEVLQEVLQIENNIFDRVITSLEYLEDIITKKQCDDCDLLVTAKGSKRDLHTEVRNMRGAFEELDIHLLTLKMASQKDDKEIFDIAVELFTKNLLEWYAGRKNIKFYDEIESAIIPIVDSLENQDYNKDFETFVYKSPADEALSINDKYEMTLEGIKAFILAQDKIKTQTTNQLLPIQSEDGELSLIYSHKRGNAVDGYTRIMKALMSMYYVSAPAKKVYKFIAKYLPEVANSIPHINEEYIDKFFANKQQYENDLQKKHNEEKTEIVVDKFEKNGVTYVRLYCQNPVDIQNGVEKVPFTFWKHEDEDCNGEIYLGDNGMLYCKKCSKCKKITETAFNEAGMISFNIKRDEIDPEAVSDVIGVSYQMIQLAGISWLRNLLMSISDSDSIEIKKEEYDKESILPELQKVVKQILEANNIEYNEIVIEIK